MRNAIKFKDAHEDEDAQVERWQKLAFKNATRRYDMAKNTDSKKKVRVERFAWKPGDLIVVKKGSAEKAPLPDRLKKVKGGK